MGRPQPAVGDLIILVETCMQPLDGTHNLWRSLLALASFWLPLLLGSFAFTFCMGAKESLFRMVWHGLLFEQVRAMDIWTIYWVSTSAALLAVVVGTSLQIGLHIWYRCLSGGSGPYAVAREEARAATTNPEAPANPGAHWAGAHYPI